MGHSDICSLINLLENNGLGPQKVRILLELEFKGVVQQISGKQYVLDS